MFNRVREHFVKHCHTCVRVRQDVTMKEPDYHVLGQIFYYILSPNNISAGHGPSVHGLEGWSGVGLSGHHPGVVDPPGRMAEIWRTHAP